MDLDGAHVVITGASRGIGAALADEFARHGARCTLVARTADALEAVAERTGGHAVPADLADPAVVEDLIARIEAAHGPIDVLVNNAGVDMTGALADMSAEQVERQISLNVLAVTELTRQVLPGMLDRGRGHVVQVSSLAGAGMFPGFAVYGATKAYVTHMTFGLRLDLKGTPIGLTTVETGLVTPTDMADSVLSYEPTAASFRRFYRLGALADVPVTTVATATVRAVEKGTRTVRLPRRAFLFPWLTNAPRRLCELLLVGVPRAERAPVRTREKATTG
jgi:short-subunit dehydrogenase